MKVDAPFVAQVAMLLGIVMYCVTMIGLISAIRQGTLFSVEDSGIIRVIHSFYYRQAVAPKGSVIEFDGKKITITPALQDLGFMFMKGEYSEINVPSTITEKRNPFVIIVK